MRVLQKEAKAQMNFFDQIQEALEKHQSPEGTPLQSTSQEQQKTMTTTSLRTADNSSTEDQNIKGRFCVQSYPKTVMAQPPDHQTKDIYPSQEEILSVTDYMKAVRTGRILKGHNHQQIEDLAKLPHANLDQSYCTNLQHEE